MKLYARFTSVHTDYRKMIFRHETTLCSKKGPGEAIGLVYMLNPGSARPVSDVLFHKLKTSEYATEDIVETETDPTLSKVINFIKAAYQHNGIGLPDRYTIHIENLFNLREDKSDVAKKVVTELGAVNDLMFKSREFSNPPYNFVWLAWGNNRINRELQQKIINNFPNAITVRKLNYKGDIREVNYPVHPLYMNKEFFLEAAEGRILSRH